MNEKLSLELVTKFYQTTTVSRLLGRKGIIPGKTIPPGCSSDFLDRKNYNTDEYPFAKLLLHYSPKYIDRYGRYLPEQICLLLLSGWLIHEGKATWDF